MKNPLKAAIQWLTGAAKKIKEVLTHGKDIANAVKQFADSPLLDAITKMTPTIKDDMALTYIRAVLAIFIKEMGWAEIVLSDLSQDNKAIVLSSIAAIAAKAQADHSQVKMNIQQAIVGVPIVYDEGKVLE